MTLMVTAEAIFPKVEEDRYLALLRAANAIATSTDCSAVADLLASKLHDVTPFDFLHAVAFDKDRSQSCWSLLEAGGHRIDASSEGLGSLDESPIQWARQLGQTVLIHDWSRETRFEKYGRSLAKYRIASTCTIPLTSVSRRSFVLSFGRTYPHAYDKDEVEFLKLVAEQIGLALDAAVNFYVSERVQEQLKLVLDLNNQVVSNLEFHDLLRAASASVRKVMRCDAAAIMLPNAENSQLHVYALDYPDSRGIFVEGALVPIDGTMPGDSFKTGKPIVVNRLDPTEVPAEMYSKAKGEGLNSFCDVPLVTRNRLLGVLAVARRDENAFDSDQVSFLVQVANQIAIGVENALAYTEIADLKNKLAQE